MSANGQRREYGRLNYIDPRGKRGLLSVTPMPDPAIDRSASSHLLPALGLKVVSVLLIAVCAGPAYGGGQKPQKHTDWQRQIDRLEIQWRNAILTSDTAAMNSLLAEDYTGITPDGTLQTKDDTLASLRSGRIHFSVINVSDCKIRFYGGTAVVTSRAEVNGTNADEPISGNFRYTRVYVRDEQGKWKIVSFEASPIRQRHAMD